MDTSSVWKIPLWEGIFFFIIGVLACAHPVFTTYSVTYVLGALLLVSGLGTGLRVCTHRIVGQYWINIFNALLLVVVGALIFIHPTVAVFTVTSIVTAFLAVDGTLRILLNFQLPSEQRSWYYVLSGMLSILLAMLVWTGWPITSLWFVGFLVGVHFIVTGIALVGVGLHLRRL